MEIDQLTKKIKLLEDQLDSIKKAFSKQNNLVNESSNMTENFIKITREQSSEISRLKSQFSSLAQFTAPISKLRIDFNKQLAEAEKRILLDGKMQENSRDKELSAILQNIERVKKDLNEEIDKKLKGFLDENARLIQRYKEINSSLEQKITEDENIKSNLNLIQQEERQNKALIGNLSSEFDAYKARVEDNRSKQDIIIGELHSIKNRINEVMASEGERRSAFVTFMEQQTVSNRGREKTWADWQNQYEEIASKIYSMLPELQNQQFEMNKTKAAFDEISKKFDRRVNELTEMYRLMDQKFRKEWDTYKSDSEKRWTHLSLTIDDRQVGFNDQLDKIKERMVNMDDRLHYMQEALLIMSREIQKGMHSLMNMVNNWMDAFTMIKPEG